MTILELLGRPELSPFAVALGLMLALVALELVMLLLGSGLTGWLDDLLPDTDADTAEVDAGGGFSRVLDFLHLGRVPTLIILLCFLAWFGLAGVSVQGATFGAVDRLLPAWLAVIPALIVALLLTHVSGKVLARLVPSEETSAVGMASLVGRTATITLGDARVGDDSEARVADRHGTVHRVRVEPESETEVLAQGEDVVLSEHLGGTRFTARRPDSKQ